MQTTNAEYTKPTGGTVNKGKDRAIENKVEAPQPQAVKREKKEKPLEKANGEYEAAYAAYEKEYERTQKSS